MNQNITILTFLGLIPIMISCHSVTNISGTYTTRNRLHTFSINTDSTFNYFYMKVGSNADIYSSGKWSSISRSRIVLNSNIVNNIIPLDIEVIPSSNINTIIYVELMIPGKDEKDYYCFPCFDVKKDKWFTSKPFFTPDRGSHCYESTLKENELFYKVQKKPFVFERQGPLRKYYIIDTEHKMINTNVGDIIHVKINVPDSLFSYRLFNSQKIKINGRKIVFKDNENNNKKKKLYIQ